MMSRNPLFGCVSCYEDYSWPACDLREHEGELWCDSCWDSADMRETTGIDWSDLSPFVPDKDKHVAELEAHLSRIQTLANSQAEDDMLWFKAERITEAHLQEELRRLHAVIEGGE